MNVKIEESWMNVLGGEFSKPYFTALAQFVRNEYAAGRCYPPGSLIFNAFNLCPFNKVKVVIIGQDPYHEEGQAHGLSFSVTEGTRFPPSLENIFREVHDDTGAPVPQSGDLTRWVRQGVLLSMPRLPCAPIRPARTRAKAGKRSPTPPYRPLPRTATE